MFAGPFPNIAAAAFPPVVPTYSELEGSAIHTQCNLQGQKSRIYYAYSKDLKNVGAQFAFPTSEALAGPTNNTKAAIVVLAKRTGQAKNSALISLVPDASTGAFNAVTQLDIAWAPGTVIGEVVVTNYIRFHSRVTNSIIASAVRERAMGKKLALEAKKAKAANEEEDCGAESSMSYADL